jgi:hypothetical protein
MKRPPATTRSSGVVFTATTLVAVLAVVSAASGAPVPPVAHAPQHAAPARLGEVAAVRAVAAAVRRFLTGQHHLPGLPAPADAPAPPEESASILPLRIEHAAPAARRAWDRLLNLPPPAC